MSWQDDRAIQLNAALCAEQLAGERLMANAGQAALLSQHLAAMGRMPEYDTAKAKVHPASPPTCIAVYNKSKRVKDEDVAAMTEAVQEQLTRDVAPYYGRIPALEFIGPGKTATPGAAPCWILDEPDQPNALGYHDEDITGQAYIKVFCSPTLDNGGTALVGALSVSVTLSHEVLELLGDAPANKWVDGPGGHDFALELCDAVEGDTYVIGGVSVSNFLLPAFFDPKASGIKFDLMGKLPKPFTMTSGGYQITRTEPGNVSQVFAEGHHQLTVPGAGIHLHFGPDFPAWKKPAKLAKALKKRARKP